MHPIQSLLSQINEQELWTEIIKLKRNACLVRPGQLATNLYYVESGSLRVGLLNAEEDHTIRFAYQGSFFGALDSFISETPTRYSIEALKSATLKSIKKVDFMRLVNGSSEQKSNWEVLLLELIKQQMEREVDLLTTSPQIRYERLLERSPSVFQEIPHKYIAAYLRMKPETLSRIKKS